MVEQRAGITWISYLTGVDDGEIGKRVQRCLVGANDILHLPLLRDELIGDEAAVAAPGEGFGSHDRGARVSGEGL